MAGKKSLIDNDFDDFSDDDSFHTELDTVFKDDGDDKIKVEDDSNDEIVVQLVDDTPDDDKNKWNADKVATKDDDVEPETDAAKYSRRVKERIAKATASFHAERRAKEDRERQLNELTELSKRILRENNQLKGLIDNGEKVLMNESTGRLDGQIAAAKSAYREAMEAGDVNGQLAAQENLAKAIAEKDRLSTHRPNPLPRADEKELDRYQVQQQQEVQASPEAQSWHDKNRWFLRDQPMTAYAMALNNQLFNEEGLSEKDGTKYWNRIDGEMRKRFPEKFQSNGGNPRRQSVMAPVSRSDGKVSRSVTLTESQARVARRLGLTLEQYAKQVALQGNEKEWTYGSKS